MRYLLILQFVILALMFSCQSDSHNRICQSDFVTMPADLNELGAKLSYIHLDDSIPIRSIYILKDIGNNIGVYADNGLFLFDINGNLIRQIGHSGRGPAEYMVIDDFCSNEDGSKIFVLARNKIIVYNLFGELLSEFKPFKAKRYQKIDYYNNSLYFFDSFSYGVLEDNWVRTDTSGEFIESHKNYIPDFESSLKNSTSLVFKNNFKLYYWNDLNDTIFEISTSGVNPYLFFAQEDLRVTEEDMKSQETFYNMDKWLLSKVFPFGDRILFLYHKMLTQTQRFVLYTPVTVEAAIIQEVNVMDGNPGINNNVDGNISFTPFFNLNLDGKNILAHWSDALKFRRRVLTEDFRNAEASDLAAKSNLIRLADSLSDESNPILIFISID